MQRRGLSEARKMLEKLIVHHDALGEQTQKDLKNHLNFNFGGGGAGSRGHALHRADASGSTNRSASKEAVAAPTSDGADPHRMSGARDWILTHIGAH